MLWVSFSATKSLSKLLALHEMYNILLKHLHEFNKIDKVKIEAVCDTNHANLTKFLSM